MAAIVITPPTTFRKLSRLIGAAGEELASLVEGASFEAFHRRRDDGEWSLDEVAGHAAEFPVLWASCAVGAAATPGLRVGRGLDDPARVAAVGTMAQVTPAAAAASIRAGVASAIVLLRSIPPDGWDARASHLVYGDITVAELVQRTVLIHLRDHAAQARAALAGAGFPPGGYES